MYTTVCNLLKDLQVGGNKILVQTMFCFHQVLPLELWSSPIGGGQKCSHVKSTQKILRGRSHRSLRSHNWQAFETPRYSTIFWTLADALEKMNKQERPNHFSIQYLKKRQIIKHSFKFKNMRRHLKTAPWSTFLFFFSFSALHTHIHS